MAKQFLGTRQTLGERIQKLRQEHGYSQEELAAQLGLSRQAIGQMEKGERSIDALELAALAKAFGVSADWIIQPEKPDVSKKSRQTERSLDIAFDQEKFRQTLLYILHACGGKANIGETVLYKMLYFMDFNAFEALGKPVTGLQYIKMQYGPVPRQVQYRAAVKEMVEKAELKIFTQEYYGMLQKRYVALVDPAIEIFSVREKEVIDRAIQQLADLTARQITDYAHGDAPWIIAQDGEPIDYAMVVERTAPYAQVDHWAAWEAAGAEDVLKYLPPLSEEEIAHYKKL
jgi:transcriptional regulator with XRE-family HTH domain